MDTILRRLCFSGLALFVFGLAIGFLLKGFPNPRAALSAHLNAVQSGTFLIVLGLLWPKLAIWPRVATPLSHVVWIAFWALEVGMVLAAFAAPSDKSTTGPVRLAAAGFQGVSAIVMIAALAALLFTFRAPPVLATGEPSAISVK